LTLCTHWHRLAILSDSRLAPPSFEPAVLVR
jgi:hypothetical protein